MSKKQNSIFTVSRPEFLPANLGSLFLGFSWACSPPISLTWELATRIGLCFLTITLVSAYGAQLNTLADYELDSRDKRKKHLTEAMDRLGKRKVKAFIVTEFLLSLVPLYFLVQISGKLPLILLWIFGTFLAYTYSMPPIRLKKRSWMQMIAIMLVLSIFPMLFVFYTFANEMSFLFILFLSGQALTVYSVIIPTEIRDYFVDDSMGVETMTVRLGLVNASFLSMILIIVGGMLCGTAFFLALFYRLHPILTIFILVIIATNSYVLKQYKRLHSLSKSFKAVKNVSIAEEITDLAANNPKWITVVTQSLVLMSIILLIEKILL